MTTLAPPAAAPPKPAAARKPGPQPQPNPGVAVLTYLRLHWLLILFCGALVGAPAAYAAWSLLPGKYGSYALLQIESNPFAIAGGDPGRSGVTAFDTYVKTQKSLIRSVFVLNSALSDPTFGISKLPTLAEQRDQVKYLEEKLEVESTGSELVKISLEGDRPDDVRKIVSAVTAAYLRECVEDDIKRRQALKMKVDGWKVELDKLLTLRLGPTSPTGTAVDMAVIRVGGVSPLPKATPDSPAVRHALAPYERDKFIKLRAELERLPGDLAELKAQDDDLAERIEKLHNAPLTPDLQAVLDNDPEVKGKRAEADALRRLYQHHRRIHENGDASPAVQAKKAKAAEADAEADKLLRDKTDFLLGRGKKEVEGITALRKRVRQRFDQLTAKLKELPAEIEVAGRQFADSLPPEVVQAAGTRQPVADPQATDIRTLDGLYATVALQAERLRFEQTSPARVWERQPASNPSLKDGKKQLLATVAAGLLGFALVGAGAVAVESRAKKVCSLAELTAASPAPVVGVIPAVVANNEVSRAAAAEAMDKLRSRVTQAYLARGATTLCVTSPLGDEGKAVAAFGLANSLALAGFKTLLVDFDLRTPVLHHHAAVPNQDGVCDLLLGRCDHRRAMIVMANGLHFIPAGTFSEEARAAAVGDRLAKLLSNLGQPFDCVVLHGHALLAAAEGVEVARRADAVLLCGSYRDTRLPLLRRAVDRLAVMEVPHVGIVYLGATTHEALC